MTDGAPKSPASGAPCDEASATLTSLRSDIRAIGDRQTAETKTLHGRIGDLDRQVQAIALESGKQTTQLDFLVKAEERRANAQAQEETAETVELVKLGGVKRTFWYKVAAVIIGAIAAALGGGAAAGGF